MHTYDETNSKVTTSTSGEGPAYRAQDPMDVLPPLPVGKHAPVTEFPINISLVFVLDLYWHYEDEHPVGVYSSLEKACNAAQELTGQVNTWHQDKDGEWWCKLDFSHTLTIYQLHLNQPAKKDM